MRDLSILIPARNEMFLGRTIENILENIEADTEIIAVLDGELPVDPLPQNDRLTVVLLPESIGQRAATNLACRLSRAKYVAKCDAHCSFGKGFDRIMIEDMQDDWVMVPRMHNLHAFDWVCSLCGQRRYQGPSGPCLICGGETVRDVLWRAKTNPDTTAMRFDRNLKFQYWREYKKKQKGDLVETMSILGAFWMLTRKRYWELDICDEEHGSWGQQGTEVACKAWLSGGRLIVNKRTWFAHMFRTQGGDFGFPYKLSGKAVRKARQYSQKLWFSNKWPKAKYSLEWLIRKFQPPEWEDIWNKKRAIIYYTDNELPNKIASACRRQLNKAGLPIICVSRKPVNDFGKNIVIKEPRGYLTMHKQIIAGLEATDADIVYLCEHDVLYHPSHFDFIPEKNDQIYYNNNVWKVNIQTGNAVSYDCRWTSQLCADRNFLLKLYKKRLEAKRAISDINHSPGTKGRMDACPTPLWESAFPNVDIRHGKNLSGIDRFKPEDFTHPPKNFVHGDCPEWAQETVSRFMGKQET